MLFRQKSGRKSDTLPWLILLCTCAGSPAPILAPESAQAADSSSASAAAGSGQMPSDDLQQGISLYKKGDMKGSCEALQRAVSGNAKRNAMAHYYLANALAVLHRRAEARAEYELSYRLANSTQLKDLAKRGITSLGGNVPQARSSTDVPRGRSGSDSAEASSTSSGTKRGFIGLRFINGNEVDQVVPGSPSAVAGVQPGDLFTAIDGRSTTGLDEGSVSDMTVGAAGTKMICEIERQGKRLKVTIQRAERVDFNKIAGVRAATPKTGDKLDASLITMLKQTGDTQQAYSQVLQGLSSIPHS